jgi:hypothetical protein
MDLPARPDEEQRDDLSQTWQARIGGLRKSRQVHYQNQLPAEAVMEHADTLDYSLSRTRAGERNIRNES